MTNKATLRIHTETGSVYELDEVRSRIRKTFGGPTRRLGRDWVSYDEVSIHDRLAVRWPEETPRLVETPDEADTVPLTLTSRIVRMEHVG